MSLRGLLPILVVVFLVALGGTYVAIQLFGSSASPDNSQRVQIVTVAVLITQTPDPNSSPTFNPTVVEEIVGTRVAQAAVAMQRTQVAVPQGVIPNDPLGNLTIIAPNSTPIDVAALPDSAQTGGIASLNLPQNCILHTIVSGDSPFGVAEQYGANPFSLMEANGLDDNTARLLDIGDTLIVPLDGCPLDQLPNYRPASVVEALGEVAEPSQTPTPVTTLEANANATEESTASASNTPAATATLTLAPTAANAQIQIVGVERAGDVTAEGVRIRNVGSTVNVTGWTLSDSQGNRFTFPEQLIFSNGEVTIYTRAGQKTPVVLYWGLDKPVWEASDVVTLSDARGQVQANFRVPSASGLP